MGWDNVLEGEVEDALCSVLIEMVHFPDTMFPRSVMPDDLVPRLNLLGFWDGGKQPSAAVLYARYQLTKAIGEQTHFICLLMSKARVTPTSLTVSIPRTELRGMLLLVRAITAILPGFRRLPLRFSVYRDSKCPISAI